MTNSPVEVMRGWLDDGTAERVFRSMSKEELFPVAMELYRQYVEIAERVDAIVKKFCDG